MKKVERAVPGTKMLDARLSTRWTPGNLDLRIDVPSHGGNALTRSWQVTERDCRPVSQAIIAKGDLFVSGRS